MPDHRGVECDLTKNFFKLSDSDTRSARPHGVTATADQLWRDRETTERRGNRSREPNLREPKISGLASVLQDARFYTFAQPHGGIDHCLRRQR